MRRSLRSQLTFLFLAIAIIPLLFIAVVGIQQSIATQIAQVTAQQDEVARRVSLSVEAYIQNAENALQVAVETNDAQRISTQDANLLLTNLLSFSNVYEEIALVDRTGREKAKASRTFTSGQQQLGNIKGTPAFDQSFETGQTYYSDIFFDPNTGQPFITVSIPVIDLASGNVTGVLTSKLRFKTVWDLMSQASTGDRTVYMTSLNNYVVAHPIPSFVLQQTAFTPPAQGEIGTGLENQRAALGVAPVHLGENTAATFYVVTELPINVALAASIRFVITFVVIFLLTVVGISFFSVWQTRQFSSPIEELAESARTFAAGKLDSRVVVQSKNEIGALGDAFNQMAAQLQDTLQGLEQRVAERTKALETSAEVSRSLTSILDPNELASAVVNQVQTAFNYYYAQIYLYDAAGENLVLSAGTGEAGAEMMRRGHRLPKGRGLVGRAAENRESVLVSDTTQAQDWLPNELLPNTKAEAAIPIIVGDQVLGVLDVQDDVTNDINPDDITLLESLAGQVAISLQNAESYSKADAALQEAKSLVDNAAEGIVTLDLTTGLFTSSNLSAEKIYGLPHDELMKVGPAQMSPPTQPDGRDSTEKAMEMIGIAMEKGSNTFDWVHINGQGEAFPCEIRLVRMPGDHPRVRVSVTDITERKNLQELTALRARQQEAINTITQRIQSATTIEEAMQVAARELGHAVGNRQTLVTLESSTLGGNGKTTVNE